MIRNSVKAIIIVDGKLLLTKNQDDEGYFYLCPGGGQEHGETFHKTLQRECLEEIGSSVQIESYNLSENTSDKIMSMPPLTQMYIK